MTIEFAGAMRAAANLTRARKLVEATSVIQRVLSGRSASESPSKPAAIKDNVIDLTAETIDAETMASAEPKADTRSERSWPSKIAQWNAGPLGKTLAELPRSTLPHFNLDGLTVARPCKAPEIPEGAQFLSKSFASAAGGRKYKLYIPRHPQTFRRALLVMLHGGTQDADDFAAGTRMNALAEEHGFVVAYPIQSKAANASLCWNWFSPENQTRGRGEPAIIAGITNEIVAEYAVDPDRVFVAGLSAGGAMAAVMGATYPDLFGAVGIHSGLPYRSASDLPSAFAAMRGDAELRGKRSGNSRGTGANSPRIRTIIFHGDADNIVHPSNAANMVEVEIGSESIELGESHGTMRAHTRTVTRDETGAVLVEQWLVHGSGHAWSGGSPDGTYTDPHGPDASQEMLRFFFEE
jgi:poly(hydroxyalkanoate) depolymerase family esterase